MLFIWIFIRFEDEQFIDINTLNVTIFSDLIVDIKYVKKISQKSQAIYLRTKEY